MESNIFADTTDMKAMLAEMDREENAGKATSLFWSPRNEGITQIRFLKPLQAFNEKLFYKRYRVHYVNGRSYFCLNQTLTDKNGNVHEAETCPICQKVKQMYSVAQRGTPEWDKAGSLRAKDRFVSRVLVRGNKNAQGELTEWKPEFYEFGNKIYGMIKDAISLGEIGDFLSLMDGRDFNLSKKGQKRNTDYSGSAFSLKTSPIFPGLKEGNEVSKANLKKMMEVLPKMDYNQLINFESVENVKNALNEALNVGAAPEPVAPTAPDPLGDDAIFGAAPASKPAETETSANSELEALLNSI